jgi:hypothetical protein
MMLLWRGKKESVKCKPIFLNRSYRLATGRLRSWITICFAGMFNEIFPEEDG